MGRTGLPQTQDTICVSICQADSPEWPQWADLAVSALSARLYPKCFPARSPTRPVSGPAVFFQLICLRPFRASAGRQSAIHSLAHSSLRSLRCQMFAQKKIVKEKGAEPEPFEIDVAQAICDLEANSNDLKAELRELYIVSAKEVDVSGRKAVVIFVPFKLLKIVHKIQSRLVREVRPPPPAACVCKGVGGKTPRRCAGKGGGKQAWRSSASAGPSRRRLIRECRHRRSDRSWGPGVCRPPVHPGAASPVLYGDS